MERLDRFVFAHRRILAALCAGLAVLFALAALDNGGQTRRVVIVSDDLPAGATLATEDLRVIEVPVDSAPDGALQQIKGAVGRALAGPVRAGEIVTDRRIFDAQNLSGYGIEDPALATVRVADPAALSGLRVGDRVDVITADPQGEAAPVMLAQDVAVAAVPTPGKGDPEIVGLVAPQDVAAAIASAGLTSALTLIAA
ncbi:MAG: SAF domain-containing protein [Aeromicrobium sp.]|uniref:SAF domain-containing protein n=1 Tax=Aeromicrobium sp. TaxID=1871063 RepID=UPI0039E58F7A